MINKNKIEYNINNYWVPTYTGSRKVAIIRDLGNEQYEVQSGNWKFNIDIEFIFNKKEHAEVARRDWEHAERKRKREQKKQAKERKNQDMEM